MKKYQDVDRGVPVDDSLNTVSFSNEEAFSKILRLYAREGQKIADPTFGNGRFWKNVDRSKYTVLASDLKCEAIDFRKLPYNDESLDMEVLDPPYRYTPLANKKHEDTPGHGKVDSVYNLQQANITNTESVIQDTVQDGKNIWVHCRLIEEAERLGFACRDILVVCPPSVLKTRWKWQRHLRKAHSYFLIFRKDGHFPFGVPTMQTR